METTQIAPFKKGDRVRVRNGCTVREVSANDVGTVVGVFQLKEDRFANRRVGGRWKYVKVASKGSWQVKVEWDWKKARQAAEEANPTTKYVSVWRHHAAWLNASWLTLEVGA